VFKKILSVTTIVSFLFTSIGPITPAHADFILNLPAPGTMVSVSPNFEPALIRGLTVHRDNPFLFDFIVDPGQSKLSGQALKEESDRMIKYFFASLTIPDKDIWVNLSPYEKDRMVPQALGETAMGRDLLAQDYMLKQLTASLIYPQKDLGKMFWDRVYAKAKQIYGTTEISVNTFNKVWIVPQKVGIYEHGQTAFIVEGHLKVMLEEDYLSLTKHNAITNLQSKNDTHKISSQIIRQIILPEIEKEVNDGKNFATLRQIFYAQALAVWFKRNLKQALLNRVYANKGTVKGIDQNDVATNEAIYKQYLKAYKKGVFNFIKDDIDPATQENTPWKYFSGGFFGNGANEQFYPAKTSRRFIIGQESDADIVVSIARSFGDGAMVAHLPREYSAKPMTEELISYLGYKDRFSEFVDFIGKQVEGWEYLRTNTWDAFIMAFRSGKPSWGQVENSLSAIDELSSRLQGDTAFTGSFRQFLREYSENNQEIQDRVRRFNVKPFKVMIKGIHIWSMRRIAYLAERPERIGETDRDDLVGLYEKRLKLLQDNMGLLEQLHGEAFDRVRKKIEELVRQGPQENLRDIHRFNLFYMDQIYLYWVMANLRVSKGWYLPEFVDEPGHFDAPDMVNPFLDEGQVKNSVLLTPEAPFEIILGSNASGKSTTLKAVAFFAILSRLGLCVPSKLKISRYDDVEIRMPGQERALPNNRQILSIIDEAFPVDVDFLAEARQAVGNHTSVMAATHHHEAVDALLADNTLKRHIKALKMLTTVSQERELIFHYTLVPYQVADSDVREHSLIEARRMLKGDGFESLFDAANTFVKGGALAYPKQEFQEDRYRDRYGDRDQGEVEFFQYLQSSGLVDGHYFAFDFTFSDRNFERDIYSHVLLGGINYLSTNRYFQQIDTQEIVEKVVQIRQKMNLPQLQQLHQLITKAVAIIKDEPAYFKKFGTFSSRLEDEALDQGDGLVSVIKQIQELLNSLGVDLYKGGVERFLQEVRDEKVVSISNTKELFMDTLRLLDIINGFAIAVDEKGLSLPQKGEETDALDIQTAKFNLKIHFGQANVLTAGSPVEMEESLKTIEKVMICISHGFFVPATSVVYGEHFEHLKPRALYMQTIRDSKGLSFFQTLLSNLSAVLGSVLYKRNDCLIIDGLYGSNQTMMDILNTMLAIFTGDTKKTMVLGTYQTGWAKRLKEKGALLNIQHATDLAMGSDAAMNVDKAAVAIKPQQVEGGIDLSQQDAAMRVTKDANGGAKVDVDPAEIVRVERYGLSEVDPVIIGMRPADIQSIFGVKILANTP